LFLYRFVTVLHLLQHNYVASRTLSDLHPIYAAAQNFILLKASDGWLSLKFNMYYLLGALG